MPMPEKELAEAMVGELVSRGLLDSGHAKEAVFLLSIQLEARKDLRGLKENELGPIVNAIRDNVAPICESQQLRGRIASALHHKLGEMGLCWAGEKFNTAGAITGRSGGTEPRRPIPYCGRCQCYHFYGNCA